MPLSYVHIIAQTEGVWGEKKKTEEKFLCFSTTEAISLHKKLNNVIKHGDRKTACRRHKLKFKRLFNPLSERQRRLKLPLFIINIVSKPIHKCDKVKFAERRTLGRRVPKGSPRVHERVILAQLRRPYTRTFYVSARLLLRVFIPRLLSRVARTDLSFFPISRICLR